MKHNKIETTKKWWYNDKMLCDHNYDAPESELFYAWWLNSTTSAYMYMYFLFYDCHDAGSFSED